MKSHCTRQSGVHHGREEDRRENASGQTNTAVGNKYKVVLARVVIRQRSDEGCGGKKPVLDISSLHTIGKSPASMWNTSE